MTSPAVPTASATRRVVDALWRMEAARLIGALTRVTRDVGLAEELAQDALVRQLTEAEERPAGPARPDGPRPVRSSSAPRR